MRELARVAQCGVRGPNGRIYIDARRARIFKLSDEAIPSRKTRFFDAVFTGIAVESVASAFFLVAGVKKSTPELALKGVSQSHGYGKCGKKEDKGEVVPPFSKRVEGNPGFATR